MDHRDLLYTNRFIPHPNKQGGIPANVLQQYNVQRMKREIQQNPIRDEVANKHRILPRSEQFIPKKTFFTDQLKNSKELESIKDYRLRRTSLTIDSQNRSLEAKYTSKLLFENVRSYTLKSIKIDTNKTFQLTFNVVANNLHMLDVLKKDQHKKSIIFHNIEKYPVGPSITPNTFLGIPLKHINYDGTIGYPIHMFSNAVFSNENQTQTNFSIDVTLTSSIIHTMTKNGYGSTLHIDTQITETKNTIILSKIDKTLEVIDDFSPGYPYPRNYKINLGYKFHNIVAVRLLNTVIPNIAYLINSSTKKNNKLKWVNESSRIDKLNVELYTDTLFSSIVTLHETHTHKPTHDQKTFFNTLENTFSDANATTNNLWYTLEKTDKLSSSEWKIIAVLDNNSNVIKYILNENSSDYPSDDYPSEKVNIRYTNIEYSGDSSLLVDPSNWHNENVFHFCQLDGDKYKGFTLVKNTEYPYNTFLDEQTSSYISQLYPHKSTTENDIIVNIPTALHDIGLARKEYIYYRHTTSLSGGNYSVETLSEEIESELNNINSTSGVYKNAFNLYSRKTMQYITKLKMDNTFHFMGNKSPLIGQFFIKTNNKKKIIFIEQLKTLVYNNKSSLSEYDTHQYSSPLIVNSGIPFLYIRHPGTLLRTGDNIRIRNSFDIFNITESEINREHRVIICTVYRYDVEISEQNTNFTECPFELYEIVNLEVNTHTIPWTNNFGRIIRIKKGDNVNEFTLDIEMMQNNAFANGTKIVGMTSNTIADIINPAINPVILIPNAHMGFNVKLANVPMRTNLNGLGTEQLFIGTPIPFRMLWGLPETPKMELGFRSDNNGNGENHIECVKTISNTVKIHNTDIIHAEVKSTCDEEDKLSVIIKCREETKFTPGDRVFIQNHRPLFHKYIEKETFGVSITKIEKNNNNKIRLYIEKESLIQAYSIFGKIPNDFKYLPFVNGTYIYICEHERQIKAFSDTLYWVSGLQKKNYEQGDIVTTTDINGNYIHGIVQRDAIETDTVLVKFDSTVSPSATIRKSIITSDTNISDKKYHTVGISDGAYKILNCGNDGTNIWIDIDEPWDKVGTTQSELLQSGFGRVAFKELEISAVSHNSDTGISTIQYSSPNDAKPSINPFVEQLVYVHSANEGYYFTTMPRLSSDVNELKIDIPYVSFIDTTWEIQVCGTNRPYNTVLNDKNGFIVSDIDSTKTKVTLKIPKSVLRIIEDNQSCDGIDLKKVSQSWFSSNNSDIIGKYGEIFMQEVDKPYTVQEEFMYLLCPTLNNIRTTKQSPLKDIFAKIMLPGKSGQYVFNTFVTTPKVFHDCPLRELDELEFKFVNQNGDAINFNELDHSLTLEIVEAVERLDSINVQMSK